MAVEIVARPNGPYVIAGDLSQVELVLYKPLRLNQLRLALETVRSRPPS